MENCLSHSSLRALLRPVIINRRKQNFVSPTSLSLQTIHSTPHLEEREETLEELESSSKNISHTHNPNPFLRQIESTIITIHLTTTQENINIIPSYIPPCSDSSFTLVIETLIQTIYRTLLIGDSKSKHHNWNCERTNPIGMRLNSSAKKLKLKIIAPDHPTRFSKNTDNIINFSIARNIDYHYSIKTITYLTSDHLPILLHLNINEINIQDNYHLIIHWNKFRDYLITQTNYHAKINTKLKIEKEIDQLTEDIINAFKITARMKKMTPSKLLPTSGPK
ncbi:hypothetical protein AVEN_56433-1 [Araneus ventricosus]|uniref:Endonuclease/exonuclease/phosphatase domain-containing protein n=1 Tax=Araneus ventricosus TaxID=182803 RepID=A0A4Y2SFK8_ARAVE|nr:hypothetical protein AVEN_56433-1 [Araneus ventricosus]